MLPFAAPNVMCLFRSSLFAILLQHIVHTGARSFINWFNLITNCKYVCDSDGVFFLKSLSIECFVTFIAIGYGLWVICFYMCLYFCLTCEHLLTYNTLHICLSFSWTSRTSWASATKEHILCILPQKSWRGELELFLRLKKSYGFVMRLFMMPF